MVCARPNWIPRRQSQIDGKEKLEESFSSGINHTDMSPLSTNCVRSNKFTAREYYLTSLFHYLHPHCLFGCKETCPAQFETDSMHANASLRVDIFHIH